METIQDATNTDICQTCNEDTMEMMNIVICIGKEPPVVGRRLPSALKTVHVPLLTVLSESVVQDAKLQRLL